MPAKIAPVAKKTQGKTAASSPVGGVQKKIVGPKRTVKFLEDQDCLCATPFTVATTKEKPDKEAYEYVTCGKFGPGVEKDQLCKIWFTVEDYLQGKANPCGECGVIQKYACRCWEDKDPMIAAFKELNLQCDCGVPARILVSRKDPNNVYPFAKCANSFRTSEGEWDSKCKFWSKGDV